MEPIKEALTFDDILLMPRFSSVLPSETNLNVDLGLNLKLRVPFLSSAMDTVTESNMAMAIALKGGLGIVHRNLSISRQSNEIKKVKNKKLIVGGAVGTGDNDLANILKVGIGPGSICTTRMIAGIGIPQITAIMDVKKSLKNKKIKIISDGGIKFSGDIVKALAAGADAIMMGSIFAGTDESPGKKFKYKNKYYKSYRGMGSIGAMSAGSSNRYFQKNYKDRSKFVPEGVEARVEYKGSVEKIIYQLQGGLRSSMGYIGSKNLSEIKKKSKFVKITKAGFYESMVHSVEMINNSLNYKL